MKIRDWILIISLVLNAVLIIYSCSKETETKIYDPMDDPKVVEKLREDSLRQAELEAVNERLRTMNDSLESENSELDKRVQESKIRVQIRTKEKEENIKKIRTMDETELEKDINRKLKDFKEGR